MNTSALREHAVALCRSKKMRLTKLRERLLDIILAEKGVIKAYKIMAQMAAEDEHIIAPPTVYRSLDFWVEAGVLHKIDAINGFIVCRHLFGEHHNHAMFVLVCRQCGSVQEPDFCDLSHHLAQSCADENFIPDDEAVVLTGLCSFCRQSFQAA